MEQLKGQTALVTGASAGIGQATARALAAAGVRVILVARRGERLQSMAAEFNKAFGVETHYVPADIRDHQQLSAILGKLPPEWKAIDILVNNAGLARGLARLYEGDPSDWDEMIDVNVKGLLAVSRVVIPWMLARNRGHVINVGSIAGHEVYPNGAVYCATKFAVRALSQGMKMDLLGTPIRVTSIDPGLVETEFSLVRFKGDVERAKQPYKGLKPLTAEDIADAVVWCATRPAHVNIADMIILPTAQSSAMLAHRSQ